MGTRVCAGDGAKRIKSVCRVAQADLRGGSEQFLGEQGLLGVKLKERGCWCVNRCVSFHAAQHGASHGPADSCGLAAKIAVHRSAFEANLVFTPQK